MKTKDDTKTFLVTGVSGYIGGQVVLNLKDQGHKVIGVDVGISPIVKHCDRFINDSFDCPEVIDTITETPVDAVIHLAGTSLVGPSLEHPTQYYLNNVGRTINFLEIVRVTNPDARFVFASSASVYGQQPDDVVPFKEDLPVDPINPYGRSKRMFEMILEDVERAYGLNYAALRFFNVCGADPQGRWGQPLEATHIFARILDHLKNGTEFTINGVDYDTKDGTCIRDYVHVSDVADACILAALGDKNGVYNVGLQKGYSNLEIIKAAEKATKKKADVKTGPARPGDPSVLTASNAKIKRHFGWKPQYKLKDIVEHVDAWYSQDSE